MPKAESRPKWSRWLAVSAIAALAMTGVGSTAFADEDLIPEDAPPAASESIAEPTDDSGTVPDVTLVGNVTCDDRNPVFAVTVADPVAGIGVGAIGWRQDGVNHWPPGAVVTEALPGGTYTLTLPAVEDGRTTVQIIVDFFDPGGDTAPWYGGPEFTFTVEGCDDPTNPTDPTDPEVEPEASLDVGTITAGGALTVSGEGFQPDEELELYLHSTPVHLGSVTAEADGSFSTSVQIPADTTPGEHTIEVRGSESGSVWLPVIVTAATDGGDDSDDSGSGDDGADDTDTGDDGTGDDATGDKTPGDQSSTGGASNGDALAQTGADIRSLLPLVAVLLLLGGALTIGARQTRRA